VPFDNYLARLHKGERVLTATQSRALRKLETSGILDWMYNISNRSAVLSARASDRMVATSTSIISPQATTNQKIQHNTINVQEMNVNDESDMNAVFHRLSNLIT
jgi:hypothetical protein